MTHLSLIRRLQIEPDHSLRIGQVVTDRVQVVNIMEGSGMTDVEGVHTFWYYANSRSKIVTTCRSIAANSSCG